MVASEVEIHPLTPERWPDLDALFGANGAVAGCWCMWWRQSSSDFSRLAGEENRRALKSIADEGRMPGLLAYRGGRVVGWCSVAPREEFGRLNRSPVLRPVDDQPVWSVVCFFIHRTARRSGVGAALLIAAVDHVRDRGGSIVEGYPVDVAGKVPSGSVFTGTAAMFRAAGFEEVARRSAARPIMRRRADV